MQAHQVVQLPEKMTQLKDKAQSVQVMQSAMTAASNVKPDVRQNIAPSMYSATHLDIAFDREWQKVLTGAIVRMTKKADTVIRTVRPT